VETDKATLDLESTDEGILAKILRGNGTVNGVNELVALIVDEGDDWQNESIVFFFPLLTYFV
jgi:pyruvate/2-oxoglutarate dehydrogenase complex dihydrolipoamide acyltransferase (E2) component